PLLPRALVRERAARLRAAGAAALERALNARVGADAQVLIEQPGFGRSEHYAPVTVACDVVPGTVVRTRLTGATAERLIGVAA
ncbi:MAG: tRNA (N(6)-L-threonylcarbamoyladenosine(37)-C(2))-methylthiotransferase MtaB, partial [Stellaceae bacterium]